MAAQSRKQALTLTRLLPGVELLAAAQTDIQGLTLDSRQVQPGELFIALLGAQIDGRHFIADAIKRGAAAVLVEQDRHWQGIDWIDQVPVIAIPQLAGQVSAIAGRFFGEPSTHLPVIGVTGTNGKTSCCLLLGQLLAHIQHRVAVLGTLGYGLLDSRDTAPLAAQLQSLETTGLTTPDAVSTQMIIAALVDRQAQALVMEVSSHSLDQGRVAAVHYHTAIFTNLSRDHLDYHGDLANYGRAKARLLAAPGLAYAVLNRDDTWAASLQSQAPESVKVLSYSVRDTAADVFVTDVQLSHAGVTAHVHTPWGDGELKSSLLGEFNLSNLLAVITAAGAQGIALVRILNALPQLAPAPGRMQSVQVAPEQDVGVIVDYAHTPDALENTLKALRAHCTERLWCLFGCGGDRDKGKRPEMGRIAERYADLVLVTNDNPRTEDPATIAADILRGMHNPNACLVIADRAQAIDLAVQQARAGDTVLIAGKGHEDYQIFATETLDFSDTVQARLALQRRLAKQLQHRLEKQQEGRV